VKFIRSNLGCVILASALVVSLSIGSSPRADTQMPAYHSETDFMLTPPGAVGWEGYGFTNPATLTYVTEPDLLFAWRGSISKTPGPTSGDIDRWGAFAALPNLGFGAIHEETPTGKITDYHLALALGGRRSSLGVSYGWSGGNTDAFKRGKTIGLGTLLRPAPYLSLGLSGRTATEGSAKEGVADIGVRPLRSDILTLFGDYAIQKDQALKDGGWSTGAAVKVLPGVQITTRYFGRDDTHGFTAGVSLDLGRMGLATQAHYDNNQHRAYNTYRVRLGAYNHNLLDTNIMPGRKYLELDLFGPVKYQRYRMFDDSQTLADLLSMIEAAKADTRVGGIAINMSGMDVSREMAWEIREKLRDFKSTGKHVVIYLDRGGIDAYHFASIADRIVFDPTGIITFEGFLMGRTYLKGALAKVGLAYDEWRFFTYKSADEALSRDGMSEADREQRQRLVDEYYHVAKSEICASRSISGVEFDRLVNEQLILLPEEALALGLVDTLARADAFEDVAKALEGKEKRMAMPDMLALSAGSLEGYGVARADHWGDRPQIAVIYAIGECAMDMGIKARSLVKDVEAVTTNPRIKAVVLRVDSPGGDGTASDIIAEALKKCSEKKPVIVSQGAVAASGGYWLSMYGDAIVAAPQTITGSIGAVGGWLYNAGLKEKLGMTTDYVKVGDHADLGFGMRLPFIGAGVPDRNLNDQERTLVENLIKSFYKDFVTRVASGRKMKYEDVDKIGQGRAWAGVDGKANGLIDVLGGLETAIMLAKEKAGIARDKEVKIVELPRPELFNFNVFMPSLISFRSLANRGPLGRLLFGSRGTTGSPTSRYQTDPAIEHLRFRLEHNGEPTPMLPLDDMDIVIDAQVAK
jgi:protease-4